MSYERDKKNPLREYVEKALNDYQKNPNDCGAGYAILRYAKQGLIGVMPGVDPQIFIDWYPLNQGYVLLRLAKENELYYKNQH